MATTKTEKTGTQIGPRFDAATVARLDQIVDTANKATPGYKIDRAGVVRVLVLRGLPDLERANGIGLRSAVPGVLCDCCIEDAVGVDDQGKPTCGGKACPDVAPGKVKAGKVKAGKVRK